MWRMPKFGAKFELIFPFSMLFYGKYSNHHTRSMWCQYFHLVGNKLNSCPRYCENIVYTEEKTATPKKQIILKMAGTHRAKNVQKNAQSFGIRMKYKCFSTMKRGYRRPWQ